MDTGLSAIRKLQKFDYKYYPVWETLIQSYLKSKKLWEYCNLDDGQYDFVLYENKIEEAKFIIYSKLCDLLVIEFREYKSAHSLLKGIKRVSMKPSIRDRLGPYNHGSSQIIIKKLKNKVPYNRRKYKWIRKTVQSALLTKQKQAAYDKVTKTKWDIPDLGIIINNDPAFIKEEIFND